VAGLWFSMREVTSERSVVFYRWSDLRQACGFLWVKWLATGLWFSMGEVTCGRSVVFYGWSDLRQAYGFLWEK